jgi:hypothetical protein
MLMATVKESRGGLSGAGGRSLVKGEAQRERGLVRASAPKS